MFLESLKLKGILSFRDAELELRPLNVLIGPNGSGKSNLIEVIALLQVLGHSRRLFDETRDRGILQELSSGRPSYRLSNAISRVGSGQEWLWAGDSADGGVLIGGVFKPPRSRVPLEYELSFKAHNVVVDGDAAVDIVRERLDYKDAESATAGTFDHSQELSSWDSYEPLLITRGELAAHALTAGSLAKGLERTRIYRELGLGPSMASKKVQPTDQPGDFLEEDGSNLAVVLNRMELDGSLAKVQKYLQRFLEPFQRSSIQLHPKGAHLAIKERGLRRFTHTNRLSDGTVRYLCLLAILCHPNPPPLICIEEPEIGLHPDILRDVALLLLEASERTQLIVTTHSDILIDALSGDPESVVVCERDPELGTSFERLSAEKLKLWLERYKLGELWRKGQLGGVPW